jgi:hypothetical protein
MDSYSNSIGFDVLGILLSLCCGWPEFFCLQAFTVYIHVVAIHIGIRYRCIYLSLSRSKNKKVLSPRRDVIFTRRRFASIGVIIHDVLKIDSWGHEEVGCSRSIAVALAALHTLTCFTHFVTYTNLMSSTTVSCPSEIACLKNVFDV